MGLFGRRFSIFKLIGVLIALAVIALLIFKGNISEAIAG